MNTVLLEFFCFLFLLNKSTKIKLVTNKKKNLNFQIRIYLLADFILVKYTSLRWESAKFNHENK